MSVYEETRRHTKKRGEWRRVRSWAATVAAWVMVLLAMGVAGLWADWNHVVYAGYWRLGDDNKGLLVLDVGCGSGVFILRYRSESSIWDLGIDEENTLGFFISRTTTGVKVLIFSGGCSRISSGRYGPAAGPFGLMLYHVQGRRMSIIEYALMVPHWFVLLLLLAWPVKRGWGWLKVRRWRREGRCLKCGYDLRASEGRCPECGVGKEVM